MENQNKSFNRRNFIKTSSLFAIGGIAATNILASSSNTKVIFSNSTFQDNIIGPKEGYSPQIGTLVSMMTWMRNTVLETVKGLTVEDLDYLHDENSNSIGAMLMHLAAVDRFYQIFTLENISYDQILDKEKEELNLPGFLGQNAREKIKGNDLEYYIDHMTKVRENTFKEFAKRDDEWLMQIDENWQWGPTNNYCKWFHICEHESNHNGQIKWIKSRLPSSKN